MSKHMRRWTLAAVVVSMGSLSACIPYSVGSTATTVPRGERAVTFGVTAMPSIGVFDSTRGRSWMSFDGETRVPIDDHSDAGFRVVGGTGVVANYKRMLTDTASHFRVAVMPGIGILNFGSHAHFEATLLMSGYETSSRLAAPGSHRPWFVPYGGLRVMQVAPLSPDAVHDTPTAGGFFGVRLGSSELGVSPEVGVFYDHSALGVRSGNVVVVPSLNFHGAELLQFMTEMLGVMRL